MQTTIFEWWKEQGKTLADLAKILRYNHHYLCDVAAGRYPITENFRARCLAFLSDDVAFLFFDDGMGRKPYSVAEPPMPVKQAH